MIGKFRQTRKLNNEGDTIVEVLVALAILSLAFAISYATANQGLNQSQNAQEHSQALGVVDSQLELLRYAINNKVTTIPSGSFCMNDYNNNLTPVNLTGSLPSSSNADAAVSNNFREYPTGSTGCVADSLYHESITYKNSPNDYYDVLVRWDGIGSLGPQQEELAYRLTELTTGISPFADTSIIAPPVTPYSWNIDGADYAACSPAEPNLGDSLDGCKTTGSSMFAYREVLFNYLFSNPGSLANGPVTPGAATLEINYNQYDNPTYGTVSSGDYPYYDVIVTFTTASGTSTSYDEHLISYNRSYDTQIFSDPHITVPSGATGIQLHWTNNTTLPDGDPNLEINYLSLSPN
jgi:type II secretory pathway pseudopilin PulG